MAGRTTLIRAVLTTLPSYYMQTMLLPKGLIKDLERKSRNFLWGDDVNSRKLHLVAWEQVTKERKEGGLGIRDLRKHNEAFLMKLCWNLLSKREALWVQVLRNKYNCGDNFRLEIRKKQGASFTWKGICAVWDKFQRGVGIKVGNGESASFWFDNWSEINRPLIDLIPGFEAFADRNEKIRDYVDPWGEWDREKLSLWFQSQIVDQIMCAHPPCDQRGEDKYYWKPSSDGRFSVSSAYHFLFTSTNREGNSIWKKLWRWEVPEKIKSFMWIFAHGQTHTAQLRVQRGIEESARCPFGCDQEEDSMHLLRDCNNAKERWISVVTPTLWEKFTSLQGTQWLYWNLTQEVGRDFTRKIPWATLFGYVCWDIWVARCRKLFGEEIDTGFANAHSSLFKASWDKDLFSKCQFYSHRRYTRQVRQEQHQGFITVEVDASILDSGQSGCGGAIRGDDGRWICGYMCKLTIVPPVIAEIIAIMQGLQICWNNGYSNVEILTDCIEAINFLTRGCDQSHPFRDIVDDARLWLLKNWQILISYIPRECNTLADHLAKLAHSIVGHFSILDHPPPFYHEAIVDEG